MAGTSELDRAHGLGMELLDTIHEYWELCSELKRGMPANDPRVEDITRFRARLRDALERAESELLPQLPEFGCVNERPVTVNGFTGSSAHQVAVKFAAWLLDQSWSTAGHREFFRKYYDVKQKKMNWDAVRAADDRTNDGLRSFWLQHDWAEHESLLELEYAKAKKLSVTPSADVPLNYSYVRDRLPRMVEKGLLEKMKARGYRRLIVPG